MAAKRYYVNDISLPLFTPNFLVDLIEPDERQRERKKPGQPSARAKFQWVKR